MKDEFLSTLSHELRTPLNAILGWSQLLRQSNVEPQELSQGLETIERNARVQTQLIEDLLDMSRIISGKIRIDIQRVSPITFIEAAIRTIKPAADAKGIRLEQMLDPLAGPVSGDPGAVAAGDVEFVIERREVHAQRGQSASGAGAREFAFGNHRGRHRTRN